MHFYAPYQVLPLPQVYFETFIHITQLLSLQDK